MSFGRTLLFAVLLLSLTSHAFEGVEVTHYPRVVYLDESFTFVIAGSPGETVTASVGDAKLCEKAFRKNVLELSLSMKESGVLRLETGGSSRRFAIVQPHDDVVLSEKDGHLYAGDLPAVLLARHNRPPPPDRRWVPVKYLIGLFSDDRPAVSSGIFLRTEVIDGLDDMWSTGDALRKSSSVYEINSLITGARTLGNADILAVCLSAGDHALGIDQLEYRMKLEWYLQAIGAFKHVFVVSPVFGELDGKRNLGLIRHIKIACKAHGAVLVDMSALNVPVDTRRWLRKFQKGVRRVVRCEQ